MKITILGARGSVPINGRETLEFGGATSCVLIETDDQAIFIDAGTGIIKSPDVGSRHISILITHPHLDHLIGMPFFPYNNEEGRKIDVYGKTRGGEDVKEQFNRLISPPLWPCTLSDFASDISFKELTDTQMIGDITVDTLESEHPGGSLVFRITHNGKSVVYATDYEYREDRCQKLIEFAMDADLFLMDAQYTYEEALTRKGYGHTTVDNAAIVVKNAHARSARFVHHDPRHTDEMLRDMEQTVKSDNVAFAREGEVITL